MVVIKDSNSTSGISADQSKKQFTEEINDPITTVEQTTADSVAEENVSLMNWSIFHELLQKEYLREFL
jgi:hypothetical protein